MMRLYQLRPFDDHGQELPSIFTYAPSSGAAAYRAGRLAKRNNGPVDVAEGSDEPWESRYITTASPSEFHATGFQFERLD